MSSGIHQMPIGAFIGIVGGVVAQVSPNTNIGAAGFLTALAGVMVAGFQYYKAYLDSRRQDKRVEALENDLDSTRKELAESREHRHRDANLFNKLLIKAQVRIANLEGQLGISHTELSAGVNANTVNIKAIAEETGTRLPVEAPIVPPGLPPSDDDHSGYVDPPSTG